MSNIVELWQITILRCFIQLPPGEHSLSSLFIETPARNTLQCRCKVDLFRPDLG